MQWKFSFSLIMSKLWFKQIDKNPFKVFQEFVIRSWICFIRSCHFISSGWVASPRIVKNSLKQCGFSSSASLPLSPVFEWVCKNYMTHSLKHWWSAKIPVRYFWKIWWSWKGPILEYLEVLNGAYTGAFHGPEKGLYWSIWCKGNLSPIMAEIGEDYWALLSGSFTWVLWSLSPGAKYWCIVWPWKGPVLLLEHLMVLKRAYTNSGAFDGPRKGLYLFWSIWWS